MNSRFAVLETSLNRAESRWKWLRFVQLTSVLGVCFSLVLLMLAASIILGWISSRPVALTFLGILCAIALVAWILIAIGVAASQPERHWLAAAIERIDRRFLDRLNTLLFLETRPPGLSERSFAIRIARQTQAVVAERRPPPPFPARRSMAWLATLLCSLLVLAFVNHLYSPWNRLQLSAGPGPAAEALPPPLSLPPPATNNVEESKPWLEVRITDPAMDLRVTKVDVVPLQIEAAANETLQRIEWFTAVNGGAETEHPLPPPQEPRFAIYRPDIYLDELHLSDWDVVTYYAKAGTERTNTQASEVYFLEVRPFREDIAKLPGGESGQAYQCLNELSGLIARQQHVIRQTHLHLQHPPPQEKLQAQDRKKLEDAEFDLSDSTKHLYARMATEMENKPIGEALDNLAKAEESLSTAGKQLRNNAMAEVPRTERTALAELVAARKTFQKAVSENPDAFKDGQPEDEPPTVVDPSNKLSQMAEFRNEAKAAQEMMQKALEQQRQLEQQAKSSPLSLYPRLGEQQQKLRDDLRNFAEQHPAPFKGSEAQSTETQAAMERAVESLEGRRLDARNATQEARKQLEALAGNMERQAAGQQLADAYRLKRMLDQQIQQLDGFSKVPSATNAPPLDDTVLQKTGREAKDTVDQLRNVAEQEPTRDVFGQPLRDALSGQNKVELDAKLRRLQLPQDEPGKRRAAGEASRELTKVSEAFTASQPEALQSARKEDSLKPGEQDSFAQGMAELESLIKQLQKKNPSSEQDRARQGQQALADLQRGMRSQFGSNEQSQALLKQLEELLRKEEGLDPGDLRRIADALQRLSAESSTELARRDDEPEVRNIDPASLPPAYRSRIQRYFERLSERR